MQIALDLLEATRHPVNHPPAFRNGEQAAEWATQLPLSNAASAQVRILAESRALLQSSVSPAELFAALEALRETVAFVQAEVTKKFGFKPLPLVDERAAFLTTVELWRVMGTGYQMALQSLLEGDRSLTPLANVVAQRAAHAMAQELLAHHIANINAPPSRWRALHAMFAAAEALGVAADGVPDPLLRTTTETTAAAQYAFILLMHMASPNELGPKQITMVTRWLERWSKKIKVTRLAPTDLSVPPLWVDLASEQGAYRPRGAQAVGAEIRYLDLVGLAESLKKRVLLLRKGEAPEKLGLGEDCVQPQCAQLVINLHHRWIAPMQDATVARMQARKPAGGHVQLASGLAAAHHYVSGVPFRPPTELRELDVRQQNEIVTFGRLSTKDDDEYSNMHGFALEQWQIADESPAGMRLRRAPQSVGVRVAPGQFLALRPSDSAHFILASIRWAQQLVDGSLEIGVGLMPGSPQPVAARPFVPVGSLTTAPEKWQPALLLPMSDALKAPQSVLLPAGWGRTGRIFDVHNGARTWQLAASAVTERFIEAERVAYT